MVGMIGDTPTTTKKQVLGLSSLSQGQVTHKIQEGKEKPKSMLVGAEPDAVYPQEYDSRQDARATPARKARFE